MAHTGIVPHPYDLPHVRRVRLLGVPVDSVRPQDLHDTVKTLLDRLVAHSLPGQIVFLRTRDLMRARRDPSRMKMLEAAALVLPVSREISRALGHLSLPEGHRYYPTDTLIQVLNWLEARNGGIYLLGGTGEEIIRAEQRIKQTYPGCRIVGRYTGRFSRQTERNVVMAVKKANPAILLVGSGLRGRDKWIWRRRTRLNNGLQCASIELFDYVLGKAKKLNKARFQHGRESLGEIRRFPWRVARIVWSLLFRFRVLMFRAFGKRGEGYAAK